MSTPKGWGESSVTFSKDQQATILKETVIATRRNFVADFDHVDDADIHSLTIEGFLQFIERQRLTHMPHQGSRWDKVLKWYALSEFRLTVVNPIHVLRLFWGVIALEICFEGGHPPLSRQC